MRYFFWSMFLIACLLQSCINKEDYKIRSLETNPDISIPLAFGEVSIASMLKNQDSTFIKVREDGQVYLEYEKVLFSRSIGDLFQFSSLNYSYSFELPPFIYPASNTDIVVASVTDTINLGLTPQELYDIYFKEGALVYQINMNPFNPDFEFEIRIGLPEFINQQNNQALSETLEQGMGEISIADHLASFSVANSFAIDIQLILKAHESEVTLTEQTEISLDIVFEDLDFRYIVGYMGEQITNDTIQDAIEINAFGETLNGAQVSFENPKLELIIANEYGLPVTIDFISFSGKKREEELNIEINPSPPLNIGFPVVMGESAETEVNITNGAQLLNFVPDIILYQIHPKINIGAAVRYDNFIIDTSKVEVKLKLELPLSATATGILLTDTVNFNLDGLKESNILEAGIKVNITNELPLDAYLQFYFLDEDGVVLDSLLSENQKRFIPASEVDVDGKLLNSGSFDSMIEIDPEKLNMLFNASSLAIVATLNTSPNNDSSFPIVRFLAQYKLNIELGLRANLKVKVDL